MSTVLWCNTLINNQLKSDESDKYYLYKHTKKLDKLCKALNLDLFSSAQDSSDMQVNLGVIDLPDIMQSTDELMMDSGVWIEGAQAVEMIEKLVQAITDQNIRFGLVTNDSEEVLFELNESLNSAKDANLKRGMFNFSVVM